MTTSDQIIPDNAPTVLAMRQRDDFVSTPGVRDVVDRALAYLEAGYPVHFRGPAGTGKTTLALHTAAQLGRPVLLMVGDEEFSTSDLVGAQTGYRYRRVVDRYIHSVLKYEEDATQNWVDNRLTTACREGLTLVYDEFTRSRPEANNVLLTVLEERMLVLPSSKKREVYIRVHPDFRVIFTSNPQEYAAVHAAQDALSDRMITMDLEFYDRDTEIAIIAARSGLSEGMTSRIVDIIRALRTAPVYDQVPTMRASLMIARIVAQQGFVPSPRDRRFVQLCLDVLGSKSASSSSERERRQQQRALLLSMIERYGVMQGGK
jgi:nitric oxide reductase NorQ protein